MVSIGSILIKFILVMTSLEMHTEIIFILLFNLIFPIAVGRRNYLFAGSHDGAQYAAVFYSFLACCKLNGVDPTA